MAEGERRVRGFFPAGASSGAQLSGRCGFCPKSASKNLELASEAAQTARFFEATQISAT